MTCTDGTLRLSPDGPAVAGAYGTWVFEFTPGEPGLAVGDTLEIVFFTRFSTNLWSLPQTFDPTAPGFVTAGRSDGGFAHVEVIRIPSIWRPHGVTMHVIRATLGAADLPAGAVLAVVYGDQSGGSPGAQVQFLAREVVFPVFIGTRRFGELNGRRPSTLAEATQALAKPTLAEVSAAATFNPMVPVLGGPPSTLHVVLPSTARTDAENPVRITALDVHGNRAQAYAGTPQLFVQEGERELEPLGSAVPVHEGRGSGRLRVPSPSVIRVVAVDPENRLTGTSAPALVTRSQPEKELYWGEIHAHTILSDALGKAEEHFECAMNDAALDFGAITDHDTWMSRNPTAWETVMAVTERCHRPGRFVTLLGYEVAVMAGGRYSSHANIYFPGAAAPLLCRPDIGDIRSLCAKERAIVIPHHTQYAWPGMGANWDDWAGFNPAEMPVVEIFSTHGSSEYPGCPRSVVWEAKGQSVQDGLARGYRFGLIAGSDYHECLLGHRMDIEEYPRTINNRHMQAHTGLVAAYAPELTREAIFEAIRTRNVYATTGERIILKFSVNGTPMGGETRIAGPDAPRTLAFEAHGTRPLAEVDIIRSGANAHQEKPRALDAVFTWEDREPIASGTYYYVRITQADGEQAWSSPIWVDFEG